MSYTVFDTETTGLPNKYLPLGDVNQPHIMQLAAVLYSDDHAVQSSFSVLVKPNGWTCDEGARSAHGITDERAAQYGVQERLAIAMFVSLARQSDILVAHNLPFDQKLIEIALARFEVPESSDVFAARKLFCTAAQSTPIVNLPPTEKMLRAGFNKPKTPKLTEAHEFFFGEAFDGAHDALNDVRACQRVYQHLVGLAELPDPVTDYRAGA